MATPLNEPPKSYSKFMRNLAATNKGTNGMDLQETTPDDAEKRRKEQKAVKILHMDLNEAPGGKLPTSAQLKQMNTSTK